MLVKQRRCRSWSCSHAVRDGSIGIASSGHIADRSLGVMIEEIIEICSIDSYESFLFCELLIINDQANHLLEVVGCVTGFHYGVCTKSRNFF